MREAILAELSQIEADKDVTILHAVESGSRAWGFESPDSDWDVRFIYLEREDRYESIFSDWRDVIEHQSLVNLCKDGKVQGLDLDISGWDLRKALKLLYKGNPPLLEHFRSPIIYKNLSSFNAVVDLMPTMYSPTTTLLHYYHMAKNNYREYLKGPKVWLKKYLYVLRPCMCIHWITVHSSLPPVNIYELMDGLVFESDLYYDIYRLLASKRAGEELSYGGKIQTITNYIRYWLEEHKIQNIKDQKRDRDKLLIDEAFRKVRIDHGHFR